MRRLLATLFALAVSLVPTSPASAHTPYCGITWGSLPKAVSTMSTARITDVRAGRHACYDRLVFDLDGRARGYHVRYVSQVTADGSGDVVPVRGGARLEVVVTSPTVHTDSVSLPNGELVDVSGYRTFRHVAWAGVFEGQTTVGLGVRARLPFRAFVLPGPGTGSRVVVDVAHQW